MFVCKICNYKCNENYSGTHLKRHNLSGKQYYDEYLKGSSEGLCKLCNKKTKYKTIKAGYYECCSRACSNKLKNIRLFEATGFSNYFQTEVCKEKTRQTLLKRYGVDNPSKSEIIKDKKRKTLIENYGVEYGLQSDEIMKKRDQTMIQRFGTKQAMHVPHLVEKAMRNGSGRCSVERYTTKFGDTINVQGSYEKSFAQLCEDSDVKITNGPCIDYTLDGACKKYFVDFKIFKDNKIWLVEIKSSYYFKKYKKACLAKKAAAIEFCKNKNIEDYILMIDQLYLPD